MSTKQFLWAVALILAAVGIFAGFTADWTPEVESRPTTFFEINHSFEVYPNSDPFLDLIQQVVNQNRSFHVDREVTEAHFQLDSYTDEAKVELLVIDPVCNGLELLPSLDSLGFRSATVNEMMAALKKYPFLFSQFTLILPGQSYRGEYDRDYYMCVSEGGIGVVGSYEFETKYEPRFLVARK